MTTVRDMVKAMQLEILTGDLQPARASELLMRLSALIGNTNEEIRHADGEFAAVLLRELESSEKANRARIRAETTDEYARKREARDTKELLTELIRSLKYFIRSAEEEMRLSR